MKLSFRQGIIRVNERPTFLVRTGTGAVNLIVSNNPMVLSFAHKQANYIVEEARNVNQAWQPVDPGPHWLYWDIDQVTGALSRGSTSLMPITNAVAPNNAAVDQHWFDLSTTIMKVWNGSKWLEKIRLFAGQISASGLLTTYEKGSQVGIEGSFSGGSIIFDSFGRPLRQGYPHDYFVTTDAPLTTANLTGQNFRIEGDLLYARASEYMPAYSAVQLIQGGKMQLARSTNPTARVAGVIVEDFYQNEVGVVTSEGVIRNEQWAWSPDLINKPVFAGPTGQITVSPPQSGVLQQLGFVYDQDSIYVNLRAPIILDEPTEITIFPPADPGPIIVSQSANLTVQVEVEPSVVVGQDVTYTFRVANLGPADATNVYVKLVLTQVGGGEVQLTSLPAGAAPVYNPTTQTTSIKVAVPSPLAAGTVSGEVSLTITAPLLPSSINVIALVTSPTADINSSNNTVGSTILVRAA